MLSQATYVHKFNCTHLILRTLLLLISLKNMMNIYICLFIVLACISITINGNFHYPEIKPNNEWWSNTIIYQVYPRSFKDSNNDGIGDLKGIIQKLDHFVDLGIETLWIGPIFKSPMDDMGYDVQNFTMIDPVFGTMDDFDELISEMNKRNLKLITDIIPNHSSYKCEWFQKSIRRDPKYDDYYIWRDAKNQKEVLENSLITPIPPNNWMSVFGYSSWTWNDKRKQFYYHQFNPKQPDFNIRNPQIHKEILNVLKFWMDKGIVGFRFDALKHLYENATMEDEPYLKGKEGSTNYNDINHIYTLDQPEVIDAIYEWREYLDNYTRNNNLSLTRIMTTESYSDIPILMQYYGNSTHPGAQIPFNFEILVVDRNNFIESIDQKIKIWLDSIPENMVANWVIENHDNPRLSTRYNPEIVPVFTALKLVLPGVDVTYYGSEIGMENSYVRPDQLQDPNNAGGTRADESRDFERSPMQWDDSINAGFTEAKRPWLPVNPNYYKVNVETQKNIPSSNYNFYKKMVLLRKTNTLKYGDIQSYNITRSVYILKRSLSGHESYIVVINFGSETETVNLSSVINNVNETLYVYIGSENSAYHGGSVVSTNPISNSPLQLRPQSVVVLTDKQVITENSGSQIGSHLIVILCSLLLTKYFF